MIATMERIVAIGGRTAGLVGCTVAHGPFGRMN
jgi:hypothetical protein